MMKNNIIKFYVYRFLMAMNFTSAITIPFFTQWGKISFFQVMLLQSWFLFWIFILEIPSGTLADYWGRKKMLTAAAIVLIIAVLFYSTIPSMTFFLIAEFLWGVAGSLISGADYAFVYDSLVSINKESRATEIFARSDSFRILATLIATPIGAFISQFGLFLPMRCRLIPYVFALIISICFREPRKSNFKQLEQKTNKEDLPQSSSPTSSTPEATRSYITIMKSGIQIYRNEKILQYLTFDMIGLGIVSYAFYWLFQLALEELGTPIPYWGIINTGAILLRILCLNTVSLWEKLSGTKKTYLLFTGIVLSLASLGCGLFLHSSWICIICITLGMAFGPIRQPVIKSYMNTYITSQERATVLSLISMIDRSILMIFNIVIGWVAERNLNFLYIGLGILGLIILLFSQVQESHLKN